MTEALLLDTCAMLWLGQSTRLAPKVERTLERARAAGQLFVSPFSAWEIGTLVRRQRVILSSPSEQWFEDFLARSRAGLTPLTPAILIASTSLPESVHGDPADRIIIATARALDLAVVTRDRLILDYARQGHLRALAC